MGNEQPAASESATRADDLAQIGRDWTMAQARIDELAETGKQAIQRFVQEIVERAEGQDASPGQLEQLAEVQAMPDPGSYDIDHLAEAV